MKHFISMKDVTKDEILWMFEETRKMKEKRSSYGCPLIGQTLGLIFQKPSLRTRVSFEVGIYELGGHSIYLSSEDANLGKRESLKDFASVISRYVHCIVFRAFDHKDVIRFSEFCSVPVINGLSDMFHPCQAMADFFTIGEKTNWNFKDVKLVYAGDGNNVLHSLLYMAGKMGINFVYCTPREYQPDGIVVKDALSFAKESKAKISYEPDINKAVKDADFLYTDVWVSMGQEKQRQDKLRAFDGFQINQKLLKLAGKKCLFMHCLPAHRQEEVTDDVMDSSCCIAYDQAENRLHVQKAILLWLLKNKS